MIYVAGCCVSKDKEDLWSQQIFHKYRVEQKEMCIIAREGEQLTYESTEQKAGVNL